MYLREFSFFLHAAEAHCLPMDVCRHPLSPLAQNLPSTENRNFQRMKWQEENLFQSDGITLSLGGKRLSGLRLNLNLSIRDRSGQFEQGIFLVDSGPFSSASVVY